MINIAIYARYSSHNQTDKSIEGQLLECHEYARRNEYTVIKEYVDRAKSAKTDKRPAFQRMIVDSEKQQFDYILVYKLDRFARNRIDSAIYKKNAEREWCSRTIGMREHNRRRKRFLG